MCLVMGEVVGWPVGLLWSICFYPLLLHNDILVDKTGSDDKQMFCTDVASSTHVMPCSVCTYKRGSSIESALYLVRGVQGSKRLADVQGSAHQRRGRDTSETSVCVSCRGWMLICSLCNCRRDVGIRWWGEAIQKNHRLSCCDTVLYSLQWTLTARTAFFRASGKWGRWQ